jgi:hypothetical protein
MNLPPCCVDPREPETKQASSLLDLEAVGSLRPVKLRELETAVHYALDLRD